MMGTAVVRRPTEAAALGRMEPRHYVPRVLWKTWRQRNLVLACGPCNVAKGAVLPWTVVALLLRNVRQNQLWRDACAAASSPSV